jgi:pyruvate dehydrogenase E2 component (dihydrolipoamide acetyltransferase)
MYGIDDFSPIINPGQSAILAIGAIADRPISEGGQLVLRPTLRLTLAVDHRVADGVVGALFLQDLRSVLEAPEALQD